MKKISARGWLASHTGEFVFALLAVQPLLDVLSYFMRELDATAVTTSLRMVLLFSVSFYACAISSRKKLYVAFYSVAAGFWLLHMLNCARVGYADPVGDVAEYLKLVQFPLWALAFFTFFEHKRELETKVTGWLALNFGLILLVIFLSFGTGNPVYTYDYPERGMQIGILGWFGVPNAQSAIVSLLVPPLLLWAFQKKELWLFSLACLLGFGLLYVTGTRLTYFAALLAAGGFLLLFLWNRKPLRFCLPLLIALALLVACKGLSPMEARQAYSAGSNTLYQEKTDAIMGEDSGFVYEEGKPIDPEVFEKVKQVYTQVYGVPGPYDLPLLGDLIEKFGLDAVMKAYDYTIAPERLYHSRIRKLTALELNWQEKDFLTKLFGFEYAEATINGHIYDPENDFQPLLYYYGYLGCFLYLAFPAGIAAVALYLFFRNWRTFLTVELGTWAMMFLFALGAAQFSGQVLRKPSVCVYFSLSAALVCRHCGKYWPRKQSKGKRSNTAGL